MVEITIKTLQQEQFKLNLESSDTISTLKKEIEKKKGHNVAHQKLIYSGKILSEDTKTVKELNFDEKKGFIVLMVTKPKTPKPSAEASAPAAQAEQATTSTAANISTAGNSNKAKEEQDAVKEVKAENKPAAVSEPTSQPSNDDSQFPATEEEREKIIKNLIDMGYERDRVLSALQAAFFNADRAYDYLNNGIPKDLDVNAAEDNSSTSDEPMSTETAPGADQPVLDPQQMQHLRQILQSDPSQLQPLLQRMDPAMLQSILQDPQVLQSLPTEDGNDEHGNLPPGSQIIRVTQEEKEAIDRLEGLGFDRETVVEAYFACDKNEELAANFLFDAK